MPTRPTGARERWIEVGLELIAEVGHTNLRIEGNLRERVGLTKGSFYGYWRKGKPAFEEALLNSWQDRSDAVRFGLDMDSAEARLSKIVRLIPERLALARGIRAWATYDPLALRFVEREDGRRIKYLAGTFLDMGYSERGAERRARLCYYCIVGLIETHTAESAKADMAMFEECMETILQIAQSETFPRPVIARQTRQ